MAAYIALDAGGTKTETLVHNETGHILFRGITPGCNAMDMGVEETQRRAANALLRAAAAIPGGKPDRAFCGIASVYFYGQALLQGLDGMFPAWNIRWEDDGWGMISSMLGAGDGCCIVCGTGSALFARTKGRLYHMGGCGYLIDTCGSGFVLGREAIRAAMRQVDGRGPETALYDLLKSAMGMPPESNIPGIYAGGRPYIASFAHTVFEGRSMGDDVSCAIFDSCSSDLAEMTIAAERYFDRGFHVVMSGGIFAAFPEYAQAVREKSSPRAGMIRADVPPVLGCALENAMADGTVDIPAFKKRFMRDYAALKRG